MLSFGKGCYSKTAFEDRHQHVDLDPEDIDLDATSCNDKKLKELQGVVNTTHSNRKKLSFEPKSVKEDKDRCSLIADAKAVLEKASSDSDANVTITDGVHQAQSTGKDKTVFVHFTASVPGQAAKWHFYLRPGGKQLKAMSRSATEIVMIKRF